MELITTLKHNIIIVHKPVKRISLKVKANLEVILCAPLHTSDACIQDVIAKRHDWIIKQLDYFKCRLSITSKLLSGESIKYLGEIYQLKIVESTIDFVELTDSHLIVSTHGKADFTHKQNLINTWYKVQAYSYFNSVILKYQAILGKIVNRLTVRKMTTRWGSCNPKLASINLSLELIKKDPKAIEYVIMHELTHLTHYYHDKNFYNYLSNYMPDWQVRKQYLNNP